MSSINGCSRVTSPRIVHAVHLREPDERKLEKRNHSDAHEAVRHLGKKQPQGALSASSISSTSNVAPIPVNDSNSPSVPPADPAIVGNSGDMSVPSPLSFYSDLPALPIDSFYVNVHGSWESWKLDGSQIVTADGTQIPLGDPVSLSPINLNDPTGANVASYSLTFNGKNFMVDVNSETGHLYVPPLAAGVGYTSYAGGAGYNAGGEIVTWIKLNDPATAAPSNDPQPPVPA